MPALYVVATPIGNLKDITQRAIEALKEADLILCEDTRNTQKLLNHYQIKRKTISYHQHSRLKKVEGIIDLLKEGKRLALVSDAGTPGISDPGNKLIEEITKTLGSEVDIVPIPGPSAVTSALSVSGFPTDSFLFLGFPPSKRKRKRFFKNVVESEHTVVFFESPYRIEKSLRELLQEVGETRRAKIVVCRELTKKFESIYRGTIQEVMDKIKKDKTKGEFVVVFNPNP
ncbi:MAG: 16S rRNA (cytidine(1402)-2'-O)-methyltransferase [Candidatus Nealsonbacteria bacterium]|nr:16S rRNA (cytidine(1402)-2'-O)-methyltransferase [Candidatus Nealsonbacteria bacterium]